MQLHLYLLFVIFGLGSWIIVNSLFMEVSAFYTRLPEKKEISFYLNIAIQLSNFFPFVYMCCCQDKSKKGIQRSIWIILFGAVAILVCIAGFWDYNLLGKLASQTDAKHSTILLLLTCLGAAVGSLSTILFYGFVSIFPAIYTTAMSTGEGFSGAVVAVMGYLQDTGNPTAMAYSISTFFLLGAAIYVCVLLSFAFLVRQPWAKANTSVPTPVLEATEDLPLLHAQSVEANTDGLVEDDTDIQVSFTSLWRDVGHLFCLQIFLCAFTYGVVPSLLPFFCSRYKNGSEVLKWSSILSMAIDPAGRSITSFYRVYRLDILIPVFTSIGAFMLYQTFVVSTSWFLVSAYGGIFPVALNCLYVIGHGYTETMLFLDIKRQLHQATRLYKPKEQEARARAAFEWAGFFVQVGGALGTLLMWPIINYVHQ